MATLTSSYIYLIESDAADNDDWITDHAGDPEEIDLTNYTEGTEYVKLKLPKLFTKIFSTGATVNTGSGGNQYFDLSAQRAYTLMAEGIETSIANADLIEGFIMSERHTSGIIAVFHQYYLVIKFAVDSYVQFTDAAGNRQKYCKGLVLGGSITWNEARPALEKVRLNWASVW